jgi:hypothetical protein
MRHNKIVERINVHIDEASVGKFKEENKDSSKEEGEEYLK